MCRNLQISKYQTLSITEMLSIFKRDAFMGGGGIRMYIFLM